MRQNIAKALKISEDQINVKATTEEGLGFTGEGAGISSQAICLLEEIGNFGGRDVMYNPIRKHFVTSSLLFLCYALIFQAIRLFRYFQLKTLYKHLL